MPPKKLNHLLFEKYPEKSPWQSFIKSSASIFKLAALLNQELYHQFWVGKFQKILRTIILQDNYEQNPSLSASVAASYYPDEIQHRYCLGKAAVLKLSKSVCFNFTLSQSVSKYVCGGKF